LNVRARCRDVASGIAAASYLAALGFHRWGVLDVEPPRAARARRRYARCTATTCCHMLELRPVCEHCAKPLPPDSVEARICSFECTFCATCVDGMLGNVCPNCGGGFAPRPVRPARDWKGGNSLARYPASTTVKHRPVDVAAHAAWAATVRQTPPERR
jgi:hypothetical protein